MRSRCISTLLCNSDSWPKNLAAIAVMLGDAPQAERRDRDRTRPVSCRIACRLRLVREKDVEPALFHTRALARPEFGYRAPLKRGFLLVQSWCNAERYRPVPSLLMS